MTGPDVWVRTKFKRLIQILDHTSVVRHTCDKYENRVSKLHNRDQYRKRSVS